MVASFRNKLYSFDPRQTACDRSKEIGVLMHCALAKASQLLGHLKQHFLHNS